MPMPTRLLPLPALTLILAAVLATACDDPCDTMENKKLLDRAAAEKGAVRTESGLVYRELKAGYGPQPKASNRVQVHYEGRLPDGTIFDSSYQRGTPAEFKLSGVIPGWTEGLQRLRGGGEAKLTVPPDLAYGRKGAGGGKIPPCSVLIFRVELLGIYD